MRQEERRAKTRRLLVDAAREAFAQRGYDGGALDAIAASVGLSKGAVYAHFPTKLELYLAVVEDVLEEARDRMEQVAEALERGTRPDDAAERYFSAPDNETHAALMLDAWATAGRDPRVRLLLDAYLAERATLLGAAAVATGLSPRQAIALAATVARLVDAAVLHVRHSAGRASGLQE
jgi:AcrR family transcriptional regulator